MFEYEKEAIDPDHTLELERVLQVMPEEDKLLLVAAYVCRIPLDRLAAHFSVSARTLDKRIFAAIKRTRIALGIQPKDRPKETRRPSLIPHTRPRVRDLPKGVYYHRNAHGTLYVRAALRDREGKNRVLGYRKNTPENIAELAELYRKAKEALT